jgi:hypothetical protein
LLEQPLGLEFRISRRNCRNAVATYGNE